MARTIKTPVVYGGSSRERAAIHSALTRLPTSIYWLLVRHGIVFHIVDWTEGEPEFGKFVYGAKAAYIFRKRWYWFNLNIGVTTLHEAAHALDMIQGRPSSTPEFTDARQDDLRDLRSYERRSRPAEAFADTVVSLWGPWWARLFLGKRKHMKPVVQKALRD